MTGQQIAYETLIAYAAGELAETEAAPVAAHLAADPEAAAVVARYRAVRDTVAGDDSVPPPAAVVARAKAIFPRGERATAAPLANLRRVVATLGFDSRRGLALAGYRGGGGEGYRLAYESEAGEVDLQLEPPGDPTGAPASPWRLLGQVDLAEETPGIRVALAQPGAAAPAAEAEADPHGVFAADVSPGRYELTIALPTAVMVVPNLEVG